YLDKPTESERAEGWGVVVPEQSNTAASCNYDPQSVVDDLPDDGSVAIVGSAHSHPGMSAYCSGVDKADQMYFDGLHITFGWRVNSPQTEFHIEMQMSGSAFPFSVNQVFSDVPTAAADAQVKKWATNVA